MKGLLIAGTDTEVGKTVASAILLAHLSKSFRAHYHKPVQTGLLEDNDAAMVKNLTRDFSNLDTTMDQGFLRPLSPHLAAFYENQHIDYQTVLKNARACPGEVNLIEGAGGIMTPLNSRYLLANLFMELSLPCIVVARSKLGTINHTLLTLEALRARRIPIAGVIMMGEKKRDTTESIRFYGRIDNILCIEQAHIDHHFISHIVKGRQVELEQFVNLALRI